MFAPLALAAQLAAHDPSVPFEKYQLPNGLTVILSEDHRLPAGRGRRLVPRRRRQPGARQERLRPPLRAHDVLGREAHRPGALQDPRGHRHLRRRDGQRHDERGPHQLLRGRPLGRAPDGALARERPHGVPARHARREEARRAARRRLQRAAPVVREPPLRHRRAARCATSSSRSRTPTTTASSAPSPRSRARRWTTFARSSASSTRPNNASLAIVGNFDPGADQGAGRAVLRRHSRARPTCARPDIPQPQLPGVVKETIQDQVAKIPQLDLGWVGVKQFDPDEAAGDVLARILGGGKASRLYQELVQRRQIASDVDADNDTSALGGVFGIEVTVKQGHTTAELAPVIEQILDDVRKNGVTRRRGRAGEARHPRRQAARPRAHRRLRRQGRPAEPLRDVQRRPGLPGQGPRPLPRGHAPTR